MAFKARVYLQRPDSKTEADFLGEIELDVRPVQNGRARFIHDGKIEVGHIDTVSPPDWAEKTCALSCAGPTAALLVVGMMDLRAMAGITTAISAERLMPGGARVARGTGAIALVVGLLVIARAVGVG